MRHQVNREKNNLSSKALWYEEGVFYWNCRLRVFQGGDGSGENASDAGLLYLLSGEFGAIQTYVEYI